MQIATRLTSSISAFSTTRLGSPTTLLRRLLLVVPLVAFVLVPEGCAEEEGTPIRSAGLPAQLDIRPAGDHSVRITLRPLAVEEELPYTPALAERSYPEPVLSLRTLDETTSARVGNLEVEVAPDPLRVTVRNGQGEVVQALVFETNATVRFNVGDAPVLGLGEGGPPPTPGTDWREEPIEFDRRGRLHQMFPRWRAAAYGSRNPVPLMIGTEGWALFFATPWGRIDLENEDHGIYIPRDRASLWSTPQDRPQQHQDVGQGIPPLDALVPGVYDVFVFDATEPANLMRDLSWIAGEAVLPPRWALGYMQSHRTLEDENQMLDIVDTFREKEIPVDAVIYLGTGFTPRGWNTEQPSTEYNPEVFDREGREVIADLHERNVRVVLHHIPWSRDRLPTLHGSIPPMEEETIDEGHIASNWPEHEPLIEDGVDAWWPDEGDWFNLFERMKRHEMYYYGPLSTQPNVRPWSLHRNGHLGISRWGGWMWSGDTNSAWKTLEGQIAVGINHSLSLSPFWGSDIGGFYPTEELDGELYIRWFQFAAFNPSFRGHGRTWWTRLPWGWGLSELGPHESDTPPLESALNNPAIEPIAKQYAELRYQLLPYVYTLAWEARASGMPMIRALWLHYPEVAEARGIGDQFLWGRDLLVAPVYEQGATSRDLYLPPGVWYDWWTHQREEGGRWVGRAVDLATMPLYVRAGAIIPFDPIRQYVDEPVDEPTTFRVYRGADGEFTLYEDDGITLEYLGGAAELTRVTWDDGASTLTIEPAVSGAERLYDAERSFRVHLLPDDEIREVSYAGQRVEVSF